MDLKFFQRAASRQWPIVAVSLVIGLLAAFFIMHRAHSYSAEASVVLADANSTPSQSPSDAAHLSVQVVDLPALAQSTAVLSRVAADMHGTATVDQIRQHLQVRVSQGATIMPIVYRDLDPKTAVAGANAVADELTSFDREIVTSRFDSLISDLRRQVGVRKVQLSSLDNAISEAAIDNPLIDAKVGTEALNARIIDLRTKRDDTIALMRGDQAGATILDKLVQDTRDLARKENGDSDPVYQDLRTQYAKDAAQLARVKATFSGSYPGLAELISQNIQEHQQLSQAQTRVNHISPLSSKSYADSLREKLIADAKVSSDKAQIDAYNAELNANTGNVATMRSANTSLSSLRRERDVANDAYTQLSDRLTKALADRAQAASLGSIAVIDSARTAEQGSFSTARVIGIACFVAALWLGLGIAAVLELIREENSTEKLATDLYDAPVYATVRG